MLWPRPLWVSAKSAWGSDLASADKGFDGYTRAMGRGALRTGRCLYDWMREARHHLEAGFNRAQASVLSTEGFEERVSELIRLRAPLALAVRLSGRLMTLWEVRHARPDQRPRFIRLLVAASLTADLFESGQLARRQGGFAKPRMFRELVELAIYAGSCDRYTGAGLAASPVIAELGFRSGVYALPCLLPYVGVVVFSRRRRGLRTDLDCLVYPIVATAACVFLRQSEIARVRRHERTRRAQLAAAHRSASTVGRRRVAALQLDADDLLGNTPIDAVGNTYTYLDRAAYDELASDSALKQIVLNNRLRILEGEPLSESEAILASDCLERWQFKSRMRHTFLGQQVYVLNIGRDVAAVPLTADQGQQLHRYLDALELNGEVTVALEYSSGYGEPVSLRATTASGSHVVSLAGKRRATEFTLGNPAQAAALMTLCWSLQQMTKAGDDVAWRAAAPGVVSHVLLAVVTAANKRLGDRAHPLVAGLSLAAATAQLAAISRSVRGTPNLPNGSPRLPVFHAASSPALFTGVLWRDLSRSARGAFIGGQLALLAGGICLLEKPRPLGSLVSRMAISTSSIIAGGYLYRHRIERELARERDHFHRVLGNTILEHADDGERTEWLLVANACAEARKLLSIDLPEPVRHRILRGLSDIESLAGQALSEVGKPRQPRS